MIQVLLNKTNFDAEWAAQELIQLIHSDDKVLLLPLSNHDGWASDYEDWQDKFSGSSEYLQDIKRPFIRYGIKKENISVLNFFDLDSVTFTKKLKQTDILCVIGEESRSTMDILLDLDILQALYSFDGLFICVGGAASIQAEHYAIYDEEGSFVEEDGLGVLQGFDLEMDYQQTEEHLKHIIDMIEVRDRQVLIVPSKGGVIFYPNNIELLGSTFIANKNDLDELYKLYKE